MRILVLGAYGLIGSSITARLLSVGHDVIGLGRSIAEAELKFPSVRWVACNIGTMTQAKDWRELLVGIDAIINCAGVLQDNSRDDLNDIHFEGPKALALAARDAGIRIFIHISAAGVSCTSNTVFFRSKARFDDYLLNLGFGLVLRPGLVLSPQAFGGSALLRGLAAFPFLVPVLHKTSRLQYVVVQDIAETIVRALEQRETAGGVAFDLVHPESLTLSDLLLRLRMWLGIRPARIFEVPHFMAHSISTLANLLDRFGWRSPLRKATLKQLEEGISGDGKSWSEFFNIRPLSLSDFVRDNPASVQERWFARLYFLKPTILVTLAFFWILSGIISFVRLEQAVTIFAPLGWSAIVGRGLVAFGACIDLLLGSMILLRSRARLAIQSMIAISLVYLLVGTFLRVDLWLDPLGPFLKVIPQIVLAFVALSLMDDR